MSGLVKSVVRFFGGGGGDLAAASNAGTGAVRYIEHHKAREETNMTKEQSLMVEDQESHTGPKAARFLGSLKDALAAAGRDETGSAMKHEQGDAKAAVAVPPPIKTVAADPVGAAGGVTPAGKTALEAAREARASTATGSKKPEKTATAPATHVVKPEKAVSSDGPARTQLVRGKQAVERGTFGSDPVVGWLVVVGGPGIGQYRPIFEGNNAVGRSANQRIPLDFGDDSISSEEQAFIRYDSSDRSFLFVPNLAKTNVVSVNNKRPTGAVELSQMDVIQMGRSQIVFVPFCGADFDWAELIDKA